ncbi:hypothetical protein AE923_13825 [Xanthomonas arboricola]|nr:hypothetical protein AE923_13825 [Xanthomonas arboricola]
MVDDIDQVTELMRRYSLTHHVRRMRGVGLDEEVTRATAALKLIGVAEHRGEWLDECLVGRFGTWRVRADARRVQRRGQINDPHLIRSIGYLDPSMKCIEVAVPPTIAGIALGERQDIERAVALSKREKSSTCNRTGAKTMTFF